MRYCEAVKAVRRLHPRPGDLIVVKVTDHELHSKSADGLAADLLRLHPGCNVAIIPSGIGMESFSEEEMRDLGWQRVPRVVPTSISPVAQDNPDAQ